MFTYPMENGEPGVLKPLSPLAAALESASAEDVILLTIALARREQKEKDSNGTP